MSDLEMVDSAGGVQDRYVNSAYFEDAGDGQMRVVRCCNHGSTAIPVFSYVTPALAMIRDAQAAIDFARELLVKNFGNGH